MTQAFEYGYRKGIAEYCRMYYGSNNEPKAEEDNLLV